MKRSLLLLFAAIVFNAMGQVPQAIKYQAIARDTSGNILANQLISMRISLLVDSLNGNAEYAETHIISTNQFGLVNLEIGRGVVVFGNFSEIDWGRGNYFVKVEADASGGSNFSLLGISQLLAVPFAMYANTAGIPRMTDAERDAIINPQTGMIIYNLTSGCINIRRNDSWYQDCSFECIPQPTTPDAGGDKSICGDTVVQLSANEPDEGMGTWLVSAGIGGIFSDTHDPDAFFSGNYNQNYRLLWQISNHCNTLNDSVNVNFIESDSADAGPDQSPYHFSIDLQASAPEAGYSGIWNILSGENGNISDPTNPVSVFNGELGTSYTLRWTLWSTCDTSEDDVVIRLCPTHIAADAGQDLSITLGTSCLLPGNIPPEHNSGRWTIISGSGGAFADSSLHNTVFNGLPLTTYTLRWTLTSNCDTTSDDVNISTASLWTCGTNVIYGGQLYHTISIGSQCWMKENLNIGTMINGFFNQTNNDTIQKYCYNNSPAYCTIYGGLYQWDEMMAYNYTGNLQGICPPGFHIPTEIYISETNALLGDWGTLTSYLGGNWQAGGPMKEVGPEHWYVPNQGATNESGFTALGAGTRDHNGNFTDIMNYTSFYSANKTELGDAWSMHLNRISAGIFPNFDGGGHGFSVRCIKD